MNKSEKGILQLIHQDIKVIKKMLQEKEPLDNEKAPSNEATDKQKYFLEKNGIKVKEGLTKIEAFQMIKEFKEKKNSFPEY